MRRLALVFAFAGAATLGACGKSSTTPADGGSQKEGGGPTLDGGGGESVIPGDSGPGGEAGPKADGGTATCDPAVIGKKCTEKGQECGQNATCLLLSQTQGGICTCECKPDNPATPLANEDSCPDRPKNACYGIELTSGKTISLCLKNCAPQLGKNECQSPFACHPRSSSITRVTDQAVCLRFGCTKDDECPITNGKTCDTSKKDCATGETCEPLTDTGTAGVCTEPGKCDTASGLCAPHSKGNAAAKIGSPCGSDKDCAGNMRCEMEYDRTKLLKAGAACKTAGECCTGGCTGGKCDPGVCTVHARNGYCNISGCAFGSTLKEAACPADAACHTLFYGGICMKKCDLTKADTCRKEVLTGGKVDKYGDYECRGWNALSINNKPIVSDPVCDFGPTVTCDFFGPKATVGCDSIGADDPATSGTMENPTNMACRSIYDGTKKASGTDPEGFCLDDTASGTDKRTP
ncbi:MAG: hypothetical protein IT371_02625 [Deltaproteobacteria bacterium]|nr:hypothetical protein [Deltaproteobacteria bacterium]